MRGREPLKVVEVLGKVHQSYMTFNRGEMKGFLYAKQEPGRIIAMGSKGVGSYAKMMQLASSCRKSGGVDKQAYGSFSLFNLVLPSIS